MQVLKMEGKKLTPLLFIEMYGKAREIAPPRFVTLRMHPDRYKELYAIADIPEIIQLGPVLGPLGRTSMRVRCYRSSVGVVDGMSIKEDPTCDPGTMFFEVHGQVELQVEGLAHDTQAESNISSR